MRGFAAALWAEVLKARRSKIVWLTAAAILLLPAAGGLFMVILKDPERARAMGLISTKAQLAAGAADWPSFFSILLQGAAGGGGVLFAVITAWVFGREFSDHTAKEWMALPTPRSSIVAAKFMLTGFWALALGLLAFLAGLGIAGIVDIPGWSPDLQATSFRMLMTAVVLDYMLMPFVAFFASAGRGYLPALGWTLLTVALAQFAFALGWGDWFPWSVPILSSVMSGPRAGEIGLHSYVIVGFTFLAGLAATLLWWQRADQTR
ncbi:MAG: ABC transporter permease [Rudaea sp.]